MSTSHKVDKSNSLFCDEEWDWIMDDLGTPVKKSPLHGLRSNYAKSPAKKNDVQVLSPKKHGHTHPSGNPVPVVPVTRSNVPLPSPSRFKETTSKETVCKLCLTSNERLVLAQNMRKLIVTARKQINDLHGEIETLKKRLDASGIVECPACCFRFKERLHKQLPKYMKIYRGRLLIELEFHDLDKLDEWLTLNALDTNADGLPTLVRQQPDWLDLENTGSLLPELVKQATTQPSKVRIPIGSTSSISKPTTSSGNKVVASSTAPKKPSVAPVVVQTTTSVAKNPLQGSKDCSPTPEINSAKKLTTENIHKEAPTLSAKPADSSTQRNRDAPKDIVPTTNSQKPARGPVSVIPGESNHQPSKAPVIPSNSNQKPGEESVLTAKSSKESVNNEPGIPTTRTDPVPERIEKPDQRNPNKPEREFRKPTVSDKTVTDSFPDTKLAKFQNEKTSRTSSDLKTDRKSRCRPERNREDERGGKEDRFSRRSGRDRDGRRDPAGTRKSPIRHAGGSDRRSGYRAARDENAPSSRQRPDIREKRTETARHPTARPSETEKSRRCESRRDLEKSVPSSINVMREDDPLNLKTPPTVKNARAIASCHANRRRTEQPSNQSKSADRGLAHKSRSPARRKSPVKRRRSPLNFENASISKKQKPESPKKSSSPCSLLELLGSFKPPSNEDILKNVTVRDAKEAPASSEVDPALLPTASLEKEKTTEKEAGEISSDGECLDDETDQLTVSSSSRLVIDESARSDATLRSSPSVLSPKAPSLLFEDKMRYLMSAKSRTSKDLQHTQIVPVPDIFRSSSNKGLQSSKAQTGDKVPSSEASSTFEMTPRSASLESADRSVLTPVVAKIAEVARVSPRKSSRLAAKSPTKKDAQPTESEKTSRKKTEKKRSRKSNEKGKATTEVCVPRRNAPRTRRSARVLSPEVEPSPKQRKATEKRKEDKRKSKANEKEVAEKAEETPKKTLDLRQLRNSSLRRSAQTAETGSKGSLAEQVSRDSSRERTTNVCTSDLLFGSLDEFVDTVEPIATSSLPVTCQETAGNLSAANIPNEQEIVLPPISSSSNTEEIHKGFSSWMPSLRAVNSRIEKPTDPRLTSSEVCYQNQNLPHRALSREQDINNSKAREEHVIPLKTREQHVIPLKTREEHVIRPQPPRWRLSPVEGTEVRASHRYRLMEADKLSSPAMKSADAIPVAACSDSSNPNLSVACRSAEAVDRNPTRTSTETVIIPSSPLRTPPERRLSVGSPPRTPEMEVPWSQEKWRHIMGTPLSDGDSDEEMGEPGGSSPVTSPESSATPPRQSEEKIRSESHPIGEPFTSETSSIASGDTGELEAEPILDSHEGEEPILDSDESAESRSDRYPSVGKVDEKDKEQDSSENDFDEEDCMDFGEVVYDDDDVLSDSYEAPESDEE